MLEPTKRISFGTSTTASSAEECADSVVAKSIANGKLPRAVTKHSYRLLGAVASVGYLV